MVLTGQQQKGSGQYLGKLGAVTEAIKVWHDQGAVEHVRNRQRVAECVYLASVWAHEHLSWCKSIPKYDSTHMKVRAAHAPAVP